MKELLLDLLLNPLILTLLFWVGLVYFGLAFKLINSNNRWSKLFEQTCATIFIMIIGGVSVGLMNKFNPNILWIRGTTLPTLGITLAAYSACLVLLAPRLNNTLKNTVHVIACFLTKNIFFCLYILIVFLSCLFSNSPEYSLRASIVYIGVTLVFIYIGKEYNWKELFTILIWYHGIAIIIFLVFGKDSLGHKNHVGPTMALSAVILYLGSINIGKNYKFLFIILTVIAILCVPQAGSGMGRALMVILMFLLGFLRFLKRLPPRTALACMGIFLAIAVSLVILITENAEYIIVEKLGKEMTLTGRTLFWPLIVNAINRRPFFGYGYKGFWQKWRGADDPSFNIRAPNGYIPPHSHNGYLDIGTEFGWVGLSLFTLSLLVNIYYGIVHLIRRKDHTSGLPLVIFTWLIIYNVTETSIVYISSGWAFYVLMTARLTMDSVVEETHDVSHVQNALAFESTSSSLQINASEDKNHYTD